MIKKRGFLTRHFVVAAIIFGGIIALYVLFVGGTAAENDRDDLVSDSFAIHYDQLTNVTDDVESIRETTLSGEGLSFRGLFDVTFGAAFTAIQLVFSSLALFGDMTANVIADFTFLDARAVKIFFTVATSVVTTILIFVWLSSISRGKI